MVIAQHGERVWKETPFGWLKMEPTWEDNLAEIGELDVTPSVESLLREGVVFYDLGAHVGFYTLLAARNVGSKGKVFSFEPDPDNASILREVVSRNSLDNVAIVESAVSDSNSRLTFERSAGLRHSGHLAGIGINSIDIGDQIVVNVTSLDSFCESHPPPDVIKIDVEGGEGNVLRGAQNTLRQARPAIVVEVHRQEFFAEVARPLQELGYDIKRLESSDQALQFPCHFLCIRR